MPRQKIILLISFCIFVVYCHKNLLWMKLLTRYFWTCSLLIVTIENDFFLMLYLFNLCFHRGSCSTPTDLGAGNPNLHIILKLLICSYALQLLSKCWICKKQTPQLIRTHHESCHLSVSKCGGILPRDSSQFPKNIKTIYWAIITNNYNSHHMVRKYDYKNGLSLR